MTETWWPFEHTLTEAIADGNATPADADDWVEAWHAAPDGTAAARRQLHEHLGLTPDQYRAWVADPAAWPLPSPLR